MNNKREDYNLIYSKIGGCLRNEHFDSFSFSPISSDLQEQFKANRELRDQLKAKDKEIEEYDIQVGELQNEVNITRQELERLKLGIQVFLSLHGLEHLQPLGYKELDELLKQ